MLSSPVVESPNGWLGSDLLGKLKRQSRTGGEPPLAGDIRLEHQVGRPARPTSLPAASLERTRHPDGLEVIDAPLLLAERGKETLHLLTYQGVFAVAWPLQPPDIATGSVKEKLMRLSSILRTSR
jgi:hypothetical protein